MISELDCGSFNENKLHRLIHLNIWSLVGEPGWTMWLCWRDVSLRLGFDISKALALQYGLCLGGG